MAKKKEEKLELDPLVIRNKLGMNQTDFWGRIHVKQSCGSRYETRERDMPPVVEKLFIIAYGTTAQRADVIDELTKGVAA